MNMPMAVILIPWIGTHHTMARPFPGLGLWNLGSGERELVAAHIHCPLPAVTSCLEPPTTSTCPMTLESQNEVSLKLLSSVFHPHSIIRKRN